VANEARMTTLKKKKKNKSDYAWLELAASSERSVRNHMTHQTQACREWCSTESGDGACRRRTSRKDTRPGTTGTCHPGLWRTRTSSTTGTSLSGSPCRSAARRKRFEKLQ
jgi:hypothetical protein